MNKLEQAARQVLQHWASSEDLIGAITALREALAEQAEQEPVAWLWVSEHGSERLEWEPVEDTSKWKSTPLYAAPVRTKDYNPDVIFNDDGTFSLTLPDGDELRIIPPQQEPTAEVSEEGYAWGKDGILPAGSLLYAAPVRTKDLTDDDKANLVMEHLGVYALTNGKMSIYDAFLLGIEKGIAADREKNK